MFGSSCFENCYSGDELRLAYLTSYLITYLISQTVSTSQHPEKVVILSYLILSCPPLSLQVVLGIYWSCSGSEWGSRPCFWWLSRYCSRTPAWCFLSFSPLILFINDDSKYPLTWTVPQNMICIQSSDIAGRVELSDIGVTSQLLRLTVVRNLRSGVSIYRLFLVCNLRMDSYSCTRTLHQSGDIDFGCWNRIYFPSRPVAEVLLRTPLKTLNVSTHKEQ